jgi:hypothetical protein
MDSSDHYRAKSIELLVQADRMCDAEMRRQVFNIATAYARLADHAGREGKHYARVTHAAYATMQ